MQRYVILVLKRQGMDIEPIKELLCVEERAVREAMRIFRTCGMQKVGVIDENTNLVFKDTRICKCFNIQEEMYPDDTGDVKFRDVCMDCGIVINHNGWDCSPEAEHKIEEMIK